MLHILDGESSANTLARTKIPGQHFAWKEVFITGPTPEHVGLEQWIGIRARHLSDYYGLNIDDVTNDLRKQEALLESAAQHEEVVLWFEHDLFCQTNLLYLLNWFAHRDLTKTKLSLVSIDRFPGIEDFRGLGQLNADQLASLFPSRQEITREQLELGQLGWAAYSSKDPTDIENLLQRDLSALPFLKHALQLHLARFPSVRNGLGRIENRALEFIAAGSTNFVDLFTRFGKEEPMYGLGDCQFWLDVMRTSQAPSPLVQMHHGNGSSELSSEKIRKSNFEITDTGRRVLDNAADFVELNGTDQWLGGVHLTGKQVWRWDEHDCKLTIDY